MYLTDTTAYRPCAFFISSIACTSSFREYLELRRIEAIAANNKIYYGADIPNAFLDVTVASPKVSAAE